MNIQEKYLTTKTNPIQHQIAGALGAGAFAVIGLFIGFAGFWGGALMIIGIALLSAALAVWIASKNVWKIVFRNNTVTVTCRSEYFHLDTVKAYEFSFEQKPSQVAKNRGNIRITGLNYKGRSFPLLDVENFSEVKKYVEENF